MTIVVINYNMMTNAVAAPKTAIQRRAWIKYQLESRGISFADIARELGVDRTAPLQALQRPYPRMEQAIAKAIGCKPSDLWPERYAEAKKPRASSSHHDDSVTAQEIRSKRKRQKRTSKRHVGGLL